MLMEYEHHELHPFRYAGRFARIACSPSIPDVHEGLTSLSSTALDGEYTRVVNTLEQWIPLSSACKGMVNATDP